MWFFLYRKNPIKFLGLSIGKFVKINTKTSINNYFNKKSLNEEKDFDIQLNKTENGPSGFKTQDVLRISNNPKFNSKESITKEDESLKKHNSNIGSTILQSKADTNKLQQEESFFSRKMNIISPIKNQMISNTVPTQELPYISPTNLISKNQEIVSSSKSIQNNQEKLKTKPLDGFFSRKLEIISPSKKHTNYDSMIPEPLIQSPNVDKTIDDNPTNILCDKCNKMIDIYQYDIHIDNHFAMELSKSLNAIDSVDTIIKKEPCINIIKVDSKKKTNKTSKKRKHKSNTSDSNPKKSCKSISLYFKPVSNPDH